jgi:hypothetical protein
MRAWQVVKHGEPKEVMELGQKAVPEPGPGELDTSGVMSWSTGHSSMCRSVRRNV